MKYIDVMAYTIEDCRVSSVLNRDVKMYGKKYLFDENEETCWSSDQGSPQWIEAIFQKDFNLRNISIQFQGGFVGKSCHFNIIQPDGTEVSVPFYPEDVNTIQNFIIKPLSVKRLKVVFEDSTDFFGRIVIYFLRFS